MLAGVSYKKLKSHGYHTRENSTLKGLNKEQLIDIIRCLEHNWAGAIWRADLLSARLKNACDYLKKQGVQLEEINKIISVEGENRS